MLKVRLKSGREVTLRDATGKHAHAIRILIIAEADYPLHIVSEREETVAAGEICALLDDNSRAVVLFVEGEQV